MWLFDRGAAGGNPEEAAAAPICPDGDGRSPTRRRNDSTTHHATQRYITLQVETCSSATGKFLGVLFWVLMLGFVAYGTVIIVLGATSSSSTQVVTDRYYAGNMIVLGTVLALVLVLIGFFVYRMHRANVREDRVWRKWQRFLLVDARVLGVLGVVDLGCVVAAYGVYVAATCYPSEAALDALAFVRLLAFTGIVVWMTVTAVMMEVVVDDGAVGEEEKEEGEKGEKVEGEKVEGEKEEEKRQQSLSSSMERGVVTVLTRKKTIAPESRVLLMADLPWKRIMKVRGAVVWVYGVFVGVVVVVLVLKFTNGEVDDAGNSVRTIPPKATCPYLGTEELEPYTCGDVSTDDIIAFAVLGVLLILYCGFYVLTVKRAWNGQKNLPNARFRLTKLFVRIQMRYGRLLFFAIVYCGLIVELATIGTCRGVINSKLGSPAAHLAVGIYACTVLFLYAPSTGSSDAVSLFKSIAWRESDVQHLLKEFKAVEESGETDVFEFLVGQVGIGKLAKLANMQEKVGDAVFCMEYCMKSFYFSWCAYKQAARQAFAAAGDTSYPFSVDKALRVFDGLTSFEEVHDEETDTHCIVLCSPDTIVLAFRGTASRKNAVTDMRIKSIKYEPCPTLFGLPVMVHKGFWLAWSSVRRQILDKVLATVAEGGIRRVFVTGHSLGGALACLCSVELQAGINELSRPDPADGSSGRSSSDTDVLTYTFGAPRVGNVTFGTYANSLLSNYWHVVTTEDPVARHPKGLNYKRTGHKVLLGSNGNLEVYPSHFESGLFTNVGGKVTDHMMRTYAVRMGQFLKAQFVRDLTACNDEYEVDAVRQMAARLEAESLGIEGLLCCLVGDLEDGAFDLELMPNAGAAAPPGEEEEEKEKDKKKKKKTEKEKKKGAKDLELGEEDKGDNLADGDQMDFQFEEGFDDKMLKVLKHVVGE